MTHGERFEDHMENRKSDVIAARTEEKLDGFIERYERDRVESSTWRLMMESRTKINEAFIDKVDTPLKVLLWCIAAIAASVFGAVGLGLWHWLQKHWIP